MTTEPKPPFKLRTTDPRDRYYFCNLGGHWGVGDTRRLIERTTSTAANAKEFDTVESAREVLTLSDNLKNGRWEIIDADGAVVK